MDHDGGDVSYRLLVGGRGVSGNVAQSVRWAAVWGRGFVDVVVEGGTVGGRAVRWEWRGGVVFRFRTVEGSTEPVLE